MSQVAPLPRDTTIKVDSAVRDRLAQLAAERGSTIRQVVTEFANGTPTRAEQAEIHARAESYIRENICPDMDDQGLAYAEWFWSELGEGRVPHALDGRIGGPTSPLGTRLS